MFSALLFSLATTLVAGEGGGLERFEFQQTEMAVPMRVVLYAPDAKTAEAAAKAAFDRIHALNDILSDYDEQSELRRLCTAGEPGKKIAVGEDLFRVLERSQEISAMTGGAFDITIGPLVRQWRRARRLYQLPPEKGLREAMALVDYRLVRLDPKERTVELGKQGMRLDAGGIAKGYAVAEALRVLRSKGFPMAMVEGGGDAVVGDPPPGKQGWRVGVAPPDAKSPPRWFVTLVNTAISTSGDMWQYVEIGGKRYSHVVDPRTGVGLTDHCFVTLILPDGMTADALSTALSVLGPEKGMKLVESLDGAAAVMIREVDGRPEIHKSTRFGRLVSP